MENNLEDVLIDNFEEKPQKKSSKRIILIVVASVVLLGVLGVSSLMLAKGDTKPKNPEFSELEIELEKLSPTPKEESKPVQQEDDLDKLIADIKQQAKGDTKPHISEPKKVQKSSEVVAESKTSTPKETQPISTEHKIDLVLEEPKAESKPQEAKEVKLESKAQEPKVEAKPTPKAQAQKPVAKPVEKKPVAQAKPSKSASQLFQSMASSTPKGFYLQVGVFGGTPQSSFLNKLKKYSYKTDKVQRGGKTLTRYLIGPFSSRENAQDKIEQITHDINKPVIVEIP